MFRWKWNDIGYECENYLGPQGYGAVQISPPQASANLSEWYGAYQPVNYNSLSSQMGNEQELVDMINKCHKANVRVYADAVFNQMAENSGYATDGSYWDANSYTYPAFKEENFHKYCEIDPRNYTAGGSRENVILCRLNKIPDLMTDSWYPQQQARNYLNRLVDLGVDGFRIDASKHMRPTDIAAFLDGVRHVTNSNEWLWVTQEVAPDNSVKPADYLDNGTVNEFHFTYLLKEMLRNINGADLSKMEFYMATWGMLPSDKATVFVNNWDTERSGSSLVANDFSGQPNDTYYTKRYELANILMLAWPYGHAQVYSGFRFTYANQGPPTDSPYDQYGNARINQSWDFIHRWSSVSNMVGFRATVAGESVKDFYHGTVNQIAFSRGSKGFVAINNDSATWGLEIRSSLPQGTYCNVAKGVLNSSRTACTSETVTIGDDGKGWVNIGPNDGSSVPAVALHIMQKLN